MLAVHLENGRVEVRDSPTPSRPAGFSLIRLLCGGICNTDLELQRGYYGFLAPGHEFVGEVVETDSAALTGRRVVGEINLACGGCEYCARGLGRHCSNRTVLGIVQHPRRLRRIPNVARCESARCTRRPSDGASRVHRAGRCSVRDPRAGADSTGRARCSAGGWKARSPDRASAHREGAACEAVRPVTTKLRIAEHAGVETEVVHGVLPVRTFDYVVDATGSADGLAAGGRNDETSRYADCQVDRSRRGASRYGGRHRK